MKFLRSICCRFDEINPLIGWYFRRQTRGFVVLGILTILCVTVLPFLGWYCGFENYERILEYVNWGLAILVVCGFSENNTIHFESTDEMFRLSGLSQIERHNGELILAFFPSAVLWCFLVPWYAVLALAGGASFWNLFSSLTVPLMFAVILGFWQLSFAAGTLKRFTLTKGIKCRPWDIFQAFLGVFWILSIAGVVSKSCPPDMSPISFFRECSWFLLLVSTGIVFVQFVFDRRILIRLSDDPARRSKYAFLFNMILFPSLLGILAFGLNGIFHDRF